MRVRRREGGQALARRRRPCRRPWLLHVAGHGHDDQHERSRHAHGRAPHEAPGRRRRLELRVPFLGLGRQDHLACVHVCMCACARARTRDDRRLLERLGLPPGLSSQHSRMTECLGWLERKPVRAPGNTPGFKLAAQHQSAWDYPRV